jgi:hypothetical protein
MNMKSVVSGSMASAVLLALCCLPGWTAEEAVKTQPTTPVARPSAIYVTDFHLDASQIEHKGLLGGERQGILGGRGPLRRGHDPASEAVSLPHLLSQSIVKDLKNAGLRAEYLPEVHAQYYPHQANGRIQFASDSAPLPREGWLVTGWFEDVQEGQAAVSATVGFGAGSGKAEADVAVSDLARDASVPIMVMGSGSRARKMPGGLITKNPYVMAAKFVMNKRHGTERDVKSLGAEIAKSLCQYIQQGAPKPQ